MVPDYILRRAAALDALKKVGARRGERGSIPCPNCGTGRLHFYRADASGKVRAYCTTRDCTSFVE